MTEKNEKKETAPEETVQGQYKMKFKNLSEINIDMSAGIENFNKNDVLEVLKFIKQCSYDFYLKIADIYYLKKMKDTKYQDVYPIIMILSKFTQDEVNIIVENFEKNIKGFEVDIETLDFKICSGIDEITKEMNRKENITADAMLEKVSIARAVMIQRKLFNFDS